MCCNFKWKIKFENKYKIEDVFVGVIYCKIVRYYLLGIGKELLRFGIVNYIESKGVKIIYLMLF